jgi:predicted dehydrogenase
MAENTPKLRWGIIATGQISSWFVHDLTISRVDAKARHIVQAIGSSSLQKGERFVREHISPDVSPLPTVYGSYEEVYVDPQVDIIYVGTPHAFHKKNCLDAINSGKHVMCEKAFAITAEEAREVFDAARRKGVFVMEAMWTRFFPLVQHLQNLIHKEAVVGKIHRVFCDLGLDKYIASLGQESRLKNPALGAGTLLDICIYSLTWGIITLEDNFHEDTKREDTQPKVVAVQSLSDSIDIATSVLLLYSSGAQGIFTSTTMAKTPDIFCRIEGTAGYITVEGESASHPSAFTVYRKVEGTPVGEWPGEAYTVHNPGCGLFWEADAVAMDITAGRTQNAIMPWAETLRVMEILDEIRRQGGARLPQDR